MHIHQGSRREKYHWPNSGNVLLTFRCKSKANVNQIKQEGLNAAGNGL